MPATNTIVIPFQVPYTQEEILKMNSENPNLVVALVAKYHKANQWKNTESFELALDCFFESISKIQSQTTTTEFPDDDDSEIIEFEEDEDQEENDPEENIIQSCGEKISRGYSHNCYCGNHRMIYKGGIYA